ncbi:MAG: hypothetical protein NDJ89_16955 [Oligoflexia bacterium]|nr:hypothetical protein [Oligoflexia bacterium]
MLAHAGDKLVLEYFGDNEIHRYRNSLGQSLLVELTWVNSGVICGADGAVVKGSYRADLILEEAKGRFRFGYFRNEKL